MSDLSQTYFKDKVGEVNNAYFDLSPPLTRGDDWWAMRLNVEGYEDGMFCIGKCYRGVQRLAEHSLPGANFVFQAGRIPDIMLMLGQAMDSQMSRNELHHDQMSQYQEDN
tara:strand:- start:622 stop:951 length:330 start_codon:yes stop_codon:yes gene_type:complete